MSMLLAKYTHRREKERTVNKKLYILLNLKIIWHIADDGAMRALLQQSSSSLWLKMSNSKSVLVFHMNIRRRIHVFVSCESFENCINCEMGYAVSFSFMKRPIRGITGDVSEQGLRREEDGMLPGIYVRIWLFVCLWECVAEACTQGFQMMVMR